MDPKLFALIGLGSGALGLRPATFVGVALGAALVSYVTRPPAPSGSAEHVFGRAAARFGAGVVGYLGGRFAYQRCRRLPGQA